MGLYGSPYDYVIHVAIIATSRIPLITSFQPPLARYVDQTFFVTQDRKKSTHPVEGAAAQESIDSVEGATAQE